MPRAPALYHFFPGRPYFDSQGTEAEICAETHGPRRCQIRLTPTFLKPGRCSALARRQPPILARAQPVGCVCTDKGVLVELTGPVAGVRLDEILATIDRVDRRQRAGIWVELRAVLLAGHTEADRHLDRITATLSQRLGPDVPLHLTAAGLPEGPERSGRLEHFRWIAAAHGLRWVYTDDATDPGSRCTWCPVCNALLLDHRGLVSRIVGVQAGRCASCGLVVPGRFPHEARA